MKKTFYSVIATVLVMISGWLGYQQFGADFVPVTIKNLMGSIGNYVSPPNAIYEGTSTTTDTTAVDGGGNLINQEIDVAGIGDALYCVTGVGGNATSTFHTRMLGSIDGTNFANIGTSTSPIEGQSTSTIAVNAPTAFDIIFGTASTTDQCFPVDFRGYSKVRFYSWTDNLSWDPNDGTQAWARIVPLEGIVR